MNAEGTNGQIEFTGSVIRIARGGFAGSTSHLEPWSVPVTAVTDVVLHEPHGIVPGFICFVTASHTAPSGYIGAATDQQSVVFKKKHHDEIVQLRDAVLEAQR